MFLSFDKREKKIYEKLEDQTPIILITERISFLFYHCGKWGQKCTKYPVINLWNYLWTLSTDGNALLHQGKSKSLSSAQFSMVKVSVFLQYRKVAQLFLLPQTVRNGLNPKSLFNTISTAKSYRRKQTPAQIQVQKNTYNHKMGDSGDIRGPRFPLTYCPEKYCPLIFNDRSTLGCCCLFLSSVALVKTWLLYKILWEYSGELSFDVSSTIRKNYCIYASIMVKPTWKCPGTYRNNLFCSS